jgi:hypothetical protein
MRFDIARLFCTGLLLTSPLVHAAAHPSTASRCFASAASPVTAYTSAKEAATMPVDARYRAPATSPRLDTLDVLAIGLSLDVFRQGQAWKALQEQNAKQTEALHVGSILPTDPKQYPVDGDAKDLAYDKRKADALELGLRDFVEKWPIPTLTVVRGWNPDTPNLRYAPQRTREMLSGMVNSYRTEAGLHWHRVRNLQDGVVCSDTPEGLVENLFNLFEQNPDLPAVLVYNVEGFSMSFALSAKKAPLIGGLAHASRANSPTPWSPWWSVAPNASNGCVTTRNLPRSTRTKSTRNSPVGARANPPWSSSHRRSFRNPGPSVRSSNGMRSRCWPSCIGRSPWRCCGQTMANASSVTR